MFTPLNHKLNQSILTPPPFHMHQKRLLKLTSAQPGYRNLAAAPQGRKSSAVSAHIIQVHEVASVAPEKPAVQTFFQILQFIIVIHNHPILLVDINLPAKDLTVNDLCKRDCLTQIPLLDHQTVPRFLHKGRKGTPLGTFKPAVLQWLYKIIKGPYLKSLKHFLL